MSYIVILMSFQTISSIDYDLCEKSKYTCWKTNKVQILLICSQLIFK